MQDDRPAGSRPPQRRGFMASAEGATAMPPRAVQRSSIGIIRPTSALEISVFYEPKRWKTGHLLGEYQFHRRVETEGIKNRSLEAVRKAIGR